LLIHPILVLNEAAQSTLEYTSTAEFESNATIESFAEKLGKHQEFLVGQLQDFKGAVSWQLQQPLHRSTAKRVNDEERRN